MTEWLRMGSSFGVKYQLRERGGGGLWRLAFEALMHEIEKGRAG
jgi:hypothetical protein